MKNTSETETAPVAVLTGGSGALGIAIARRLIDDGYRVVLAARNLDRLRAVADKLDANGEVAIVSADVTEQAGRAAIIAESLHAFGRIDLLVNNAGAEHLGRLDQHEAQDVQHMMQMNLVAPIELARGITPIMERQGGGHIVNICTMAAKTPMTTMTVYGATKAGLGHFSTLLRRELADHNIGVSAVYPGAIAGEGMFAEMQASSGVQFPKAMPTSTADWVAKHVIAAIKRNRAEVFAAPGGKVMARHPKLAGFMLQRMGVAAAFAEVGDRRAPERSTYPTTEPAAS